MSTYPPVGRPTYQKALLRQQQQALDEARTLRHREEVGRWRRRAIDAELLVETLRMQLAMQSKEIA